MPRSASRDPYDLRRSRTSIAFALTASRLAGETPCAGVGNAPWEGPGPALTVVPMRRLLLLTAIFSMYATVAHAAPEIREGTAATPAALAPTVDAFRAQLGGALNPNNGQKFESGRREINWDGVPDNFSSPNAMPP